jgi:hypothetical protein
LESTFLEFCGTYSSSQKRNLDDLQFTFYGWFDIGLRWWWQ